MKNYYKILIFSFLVLILNQTQAQFDGYYDAEDYQGLDSLFIYFPAKTDAVMRDNQTMKTLNKVADFMLKNPAFRIRLDGHAESKEMSDENENRILSVKRASKIRHFLMTQGVAKCKIKVEGYGSSDPIFSDSIPVLAEGSQKNTLLANKSMRAYYKKHGIKTPKKVRKQIEKYESTKHEGNAHAIKSVKTNRRVECLFYLNEDQNITLDFLLSDTLEIVDTVSRQMVFNHNTITPDNVEIALKMAQKALEENPETSIIICRFDSVNPKLEDRMTFLIDRFTSKLTKKPIYFSLFPCKEWQIYIGLYNSKCRKEEME